MRLGLLNFNILLDRCNSNTNSYSHVPDTEAEKGQAIISCRSSRKVSNPNNFIKSLTNILFKSWKPFQIRLFSFKSQFVFGNPWICFKIAKSFTKSRKVLLQIAESFTKSRKVLQIAKSFTNREVFHYEPANMTGGGFAFNVWE